MRHSRLINCLLLVGGTLDLALAAAVRPVRRDGPAPALPSDPDTTTYCTWWVDLTADKSCSDLLSENLITLADFRRWNPSIAENCVLTTGRSYCVEAFFEPAPPGGPTTTTSTTSLSTSSTPAPTTTKPPNGIETPVPTQPEIVDNCDEFYLVEPNDTCAKVAGTHGITPAQLIAWNPSVGSDCRGLQAYVYACVSIIGHEPTPTEPGNGIETPTPIQSGMVKNCNKFHFVEDGQTCQSLLTRYSISLSQFVTWNPDAGSDCRGLWVNTYACVGVIGGSSTTPAPVTTTTAAGNGIATPTPTQPDIVNNCDSFYFINDGDTCASVVSKSGISLSQFITWNPRVNNDCSGLWKNAYACISIIGHTPTPTNPGNGITTPSPIQDGMTKSCKTFHFVTSGDTCATLATRYKITVAQFTSWNPAVGSTCSNLWGSTYACVAVL